MDEIAVELEDLVTSPREVQRVELKSWLDLSDRIVQANVARHIAALANYGGGYLLFGFEDDGTPAEDRPDDLGGYSKDRIAGIAEKYLTPPLHCRIESVKRRGTENRHPVVVVPPHGAVPICAKKGGPEDDKGKPQGIKAGVYYIRDPRPQSVPILRPEQWTDVIRRCVLSEREHLLSGMSKLLAGGGMLVAETAGSSVLSKWHDTSHARWVEILSKQNPKWPVEIAPNHYQLSYRFVVAGASRHLSLPELLKTMDAAGDAVKTVVWTGWSMFFHIHAKGSAPTVGVDTSTGEEVELYEAHSLSDPYSTIGMRDFWRFTLDGRATVVRAYREDRQEVHKSAAEIKRPGTYLSPRTLVRELTEFVTHAKEMSKAFEGAENVEFRCTWRGLTDRSIDDSDSWAEWNLRVSHQNSRTVSRSYSVEDLVVRPCAVVAEVANPVLRLFDGLEIPPEWIESLLPSFRI